jgi:hypothetical protein
MQFSALLLSLFAAAAVASPIDESVQSIQVGNAPCLSCATAPLT